MPKDKTIIKITKDNKTKIDLGRTTPKPSNILKPKQPKSKKQNK